MLTGRSTLKQKKPPHGTPTVLLLLAISDFMLHVDDHSPVCGVQRLSPSADFCHHRQASCCSRILVRTPEKESHVNQGYCRDFFLVQLDLIRTYTFTSSLCHGHQPSSCVLLSQSSPPRYVSLPILSDKNIIAVNPSRCHSEEQVEACANSLNYRTISQVRSLGRSQLARTQRQ